MMGATRDCGFDDRLEVTLTLKIAGTSHIFKAGDIKHFDVDIQPYGFSGHAVFWFVANTPTSTDALFSSFIGNDLIEVTLKFQRENDQVWEEATPMTVTGVVMERHVEERAFEDVKGQSILHRKYSITFSDRAAAFWGQHRPTTIMVDKSIKDLVDAQTPKGVTVKYPWTGATTQKPVLALALGGDGNDASFYDFLLWFLDKENLGLHYDSAADTVSLVSSKPESSGTKTIRNSETAWFEVHFPEVRRDAGNVLNAYTDAATKKKTLTNANAVTGLRTDHLIRTSIENDTTTRGTLETARSTQRQSEAIVFFKSFPTTPLVWPAQAKFDDEFGKKIHPSGKTYRACRSRIVAHAAAQEATDDNEEAANAYRIEYELMLELAADTTFLAPEFIPPSWPFHVEGKVKSEVGEDADETYQIYQDAASQDVYRVKVPLYDDIEVIAPFLPYYQTGHFYFPAYKGERVLLEMHFDRAFVREFLDFRAGGRLAADTQGNHLLMGKKAKDQTSIRHVYVEEKPKLMIERTKEKDWQLITVSEGVIRLETQEKDE